MGGRREREGNDQSKRVAYLWRSYEAAPRRLKDVGNARAEILRELQGLLDDGHQKIVARDAVVARNQIRGARVSAATLDRWTSRIRGLEIQHWPAALVPEYLGRATTADIPVEAWDLFKADYLRLEKPAASSCYARLQRVAKVRRWELPCLRTFERRIEKEVPRSVITLKREGQDALARTFPAQERDRTIFYALEAVNADGHKFDVFVRTPMGAVVRPILVGVQDLYSGKILGWRMAETESADLARLAFRDVVHRFGIPSRAWLDNGRGFASKMLTGGTPNRFRFKVRDEDPTGMLVSLGIQIHWATPYHGQAKPIERAWRDLCESIAKHPACAGAYTGNKPDAKPENYGSKAVPWADFVAIVDSEITAHNARTKRRSRVCGGVLSFDQAFSASYSQAAIRKATIEQLRLMLLVSDVVTANQYDGSVRIAGNRYWCAALAEYAGRKVQLRFDPDALHASVSVYALNDIFVGEADCVAAVGFADTSAAREHARAKREFIRSTKQQAQATVRMAAASVAAQLPQFAPELPPSAGVIAPLFGTPRLLGSPVDRDAEEAREKRFQLLMKKMSESKS